MPISDIVRFTVSMEESLFDKPAAGTTGRSLRPGN